MPHHGVFATQGIGIGNTQGQGSHALVFDGWGRSGTLCLWVICCKLIFPIALYRRGHLLRHPWGGSGERLCNSQLAFGLQRGGYTGPVFPTLTMSSKLLCVRTGQN